MMLPDTIPFVFKPCSIRRTLAEFGIVFVTFVPAHATQAADDQKQVLVLYSTRRDAQIAVVGDRDLPRILEQGLPQGLDYYSEYIDRVRFPDPEYQPAFRDFVRLKYKDQQFDLVIAMS